MKTLTIHYKAPPTLKRFLDSDAQVRLAVGPLGSGKSSACNTEILRRSARTPPGADGIRRSRWCVVRNTYRQLEDTTIPTFKQWVPEPLHHFHKQASKAVIKFNDVEAEVLFRALDKPEDIGNLLSLELTGGYLNEAKEIPRAVFDMIQLRIGRYPARKDMPSGVFPWTGLWADTNPMDTDHYLYKIFEEERPEGFELFKQPGGLDPDAENIENLPPGYYLKGMAGKKKEWIDVYIHGKYGFVSDGKPIYPEFQDSVHVRPTKLIRGAPIIVGIDFGLTPAATFSQHDPSTGQYQVLSEFVSERLGAQRFGKEVAKILKTTYRGHPVVAWGDPAGMQSAQTDERTPFDVVRAEGVPADPAPTNDFTLRREAVANLLTTLTMLGEPALIVDPACKFLRKGMNGGYCFRRLQVAGDERYEDKPNKNIYSHVCESLQYAAVGEGEDRRVLDGGEQRQVVVKTRVVLANGTVLGRR